MSNLLRSLADSIVGGKSVVSVENGRQVRRRNKPSGGSRASFDAGSKVSSTARSTSSTSQAAKSSALQPTGSRTMSCAGISEATGSRVSSSGPGDKYVKIDEWDYENWNEYMEEKHAAKAAFQKSTDSDGHKLGELIAESDCVILHMGEKEYLAAKSPTDRSRWILYSSPEAPDVRDAIREASEAGSIASGHSRESRRSHRSRGANDHGRYAASGVSGKALSTISSSSTLKPGHSISVYEGLPRH